MLMTITEFIEKAIEGGWNPMGSRPYKNRQQDWVVLIDSTGSSSTEVSVRHIQHFLLDPLAWQAVGRMKSRELEEKFPSATAKLPEREFAEWYANHAMHEMVAALNSKKTLEAYLETL